MTRRSRGPRLAVWLLTAALACAESGEEEPRYAAPARARAALVLEPPLVAVGELASLDLVVVTKPGQAVAPKDLPGKVPGFWLLEREPAAVVKEPARWLHRTRLRLRAVEVGRFEFPGGSVEVQSPEGASAVLHYDALPLEVTSVLPAHAARTSPYGIRTLPFATGSPRGGVTAFAAGALLALASVGLVALARRRLAAREEPEPETASVTPSWVRARAQLDAARAALDTSPRRSLDLASAALREYAVRRFGGDATVRTTEELAASQPPFTMTTRWSGFVALLEELDAARFPPAHAGRETAAALLERVGEFVESAVPKESRE